MNLRLYPLESVHSIKYDWNKCFPSSLALHALNERCLLAGEISFKSVLPYNKNEFSTKRSSMFTMKQVCAMF